MSESVDTKIMSLVPDSLVPAYPLVPAAPLVFEPITIESQFTT